MDSNIDLSSIMVGYSDTPSPAVPSILEPKTKKKTVAAEPIGEDDETVRSLSPESSFFSTHFPPSSRTSSPLNSISSPTRN